MQSDRNRSQKHSYDNCEFLRRNRNRIAVKTVSSSFSAIEWKSIKMSLAMLSPNSAKRQIGSQIMADNYKFDIVKEFLCFGFTVTSNLVIKHRMTFANRCYTLRPN